MTLKRMIMNQNLKVRLVLWLVRGGVEQQQLTDLNSLINSVSLSSSKDWWVFNISGDGSFSVKAIRFEVYTLLSIIQASFSIYCSKANSEGLLGSEWEEFKNFYKGADVEKCDKSELKMYLDEVASEATFSAGGRVIDPYRSALKSSKCCFVEGIELDKIME
nr:RNA-directed DNA polymerase, eukaryota [Tanacetum cinerariifolium]